MKLETKNIKIKTSESWKLFTLTNDNGMKVEFLDYGGIITKILVPDKDGNMENIVLSYKNYNDYIINPFYFGAIIGRVAGRIKMATLQLDGNAYRLEANDGENCLHGGSSGLHQVRWETEPFQVDDQIAVTLKYRSVDGEGGFPGNVSIEVSYILNNANQFVIKYNAKSDQTTALTLTNHSYFNLSGNLKHTVHNHHVVLDSQRFVELDEKLIPTGKILDVEGTAFDFQKGRELRDGLNGKTLQNQVADDGYDHYFIFDNNSVDAIVARDSASGRVLSIQTNQPGVVMYTSNTLPEGLQLAEELSRRYLGVCFETQSSPGALHEKSLPNVFLEAGEVYEKQTVFTFGVED